MDEDREFDKVLMNIKGASGSVVALSLLSARATYYVVVFLMRMIKKGLLAAGVGNNFQSFVKATEGNYNIYNIPLSKERAQKLVWLNELELQLQNEKNPIKKAALKNDIKNLQGSIPELGQLKDLKISHFVLPKVNGKDSMIQVAVAAKDDSLYKTWFANHVRTEFSGGQKDMEEIRTFTEDHYQIYNLPLEGEELSAILPDFDKLGINYHILPDLKVGDGNSQIVIPQADASKFQMWAHMWRDQQLRNGNENPGEIYSMDESSYANTGTVTEGEYVESADPPYQEANAEFEKAAAEKGLSEKPYRASLGKENSEEFVRLSKDSNYEKITINHETLIKNMEPSDRAREMQQKGYFISRIPYTFKEHEETLILPVEHVFQTDDGKTYVAFLPKNGKTMVADKSGNIEQRDFEETFKPYDDVTRNLKKVETLKKKQPVKEQAPVHPLASTSKAAPKTPAVKPPSLKA